MNSLWLLRRVEECTDKKNWMPIVPHIAANCFSKDKINPEIVKSTHMDILKMLLEAEQNGLVESWYEDGPTGAIQFWKLTPQGSSMIRGTS